MEQPGRDGDVNVLRLKSSMVDFFGRFPESDPSEYLLLDTFRSSAKRYKAIIIQLHCWQLSRVLSQSPKLSRFNYLEQQLSRYHPSELRPSHPHQLAHPTAHLCRTFSDPPARVRDAKPLMA